MDFDRESILASFLAEAQEALDQMEQLLLELEAGPVSDEVLHGVFRLAHTIKGNSYSLGFDALAGFAHVIEDLLDVIREHHEPAGKAVAALLLNAVDELRILVPAAANGADVLTAQQQELSRRIQEEAGNWIKTAEPQMAALPDVSPVTAESEASGRVSTRTLRADIARLDRMLNLAGEIAIIQGRMRRMLENLGKAVGREVLEVHGEAERLFMDLQEEVMRVRMVPVGPMFRQLARSVRDISGSHGKLARLEVSGGDVEVDTTMLEHLKDPLLHMIRKNRPCAKGRAKIRAGWYDFRPHTAVAASS
jgi:two-component system chemotaxis sensor kinase CheA